MKGNRFEESKAIMPEGITKLPPWLGDILN